MQPPSLSDGERRVMDALMDIGTAQPKLTAHIAIATGLTVAAVNGHLVNLRRKYKVVTTQALYDTATRYGTLFNPPRDGP